MKKQLKGKLKLNKLTVTNLSNARGGSPILPCLCDGLITNGAFNRDNPTRWETICVHTCLPSCIAANCG